MPSKLIQWFVIIVAVGVIGSLLVVLVQHARTAARKMTSSNHLKSIGLAIHNFESTYKYLPSGCDAEAKHGWMSRIHPYMESSAWYSETDFNVSWEHPLNKNHFKVIMQSYQIPDLESPYTIEGYGITSYLANPALLHRNSRVKFSELTAGLSNVWLLGESAGNKTPFGYPFNWHDLTLPLNADAEGFGAWSNGFHLCKADGSVGFLSNQSDSAFVMELAQAAPLPTQELYSKPHREFKLTNKPSRKFVEFGRKKNVRPSKSDPPENRVYLAGDGTAEFLDLQSDLIDVDVLMAKYLEAKVLRIKYPQSEHELKRICSLKDLETLCLHRYSPDPNAVRGLELDLVLEGLKKLTKLKFLELNAEADELPTVRQVLPHCEVVLSKGW
jgi:Protein of unknown function (DUF1559)